MFSFFLLKLCFPVFPGNLQNFSREVESGATLPEFWRRRTKFATERTAPKCHRKRSKILSPTSTFEINSNKSNFIIIVPTSISCASLSLPAASEQADNFSGAFNARVISVSDHRAVVYPTDYATMSFSQGWSAACPAGNTHSLRFRVFNETPSHLYFLFLFFINRVLNIPYCLSLPAARAVVDVEPLPSLPSNSQGDISNLIT